MKLYYYGLKVYNDLPSVEAAVAEMLSALQGKPNTWCKVKRLSGDPINGFNVPTDALTDAEILNLSGDGWYSVAAEISGFNETGLTAAQALDAVNKLRTEYADYYRVNKYDIIEQADASQDFSAYLSS